MLLTPRSNASNCGRTVEVVVRMRALERRGLSGSALCKRVQHQERAQDALWRASSAPHSE